MRFIGLWLILMALLAFLGCGKAFYMEDNTMDITNITNKLSWNESTLNNEIQNVTSEMNASTRFIIHFTNIVYKGINSMGYIVFETGKVFIELGYLNPEFGYLAFGKWITMLLIIIICLILMPMIPIILALIYMLYKGICWCINKLKKRKRKQ